MKETSFSDQNLTFANHSKKKIGNLSVQPDLSGSNDFRVGRKNGDLSIVLFFSRVALRTYQHPRTRTVIFSWFIKLMHSVAATKSTHDFMIINMFSRNRRLWQKEQELVPRQCSVKKLLKTPIDVSCSYPDNHWENLHRQRVSPAHAEKWLSRS